MGQCVIPIGRLVTWCNFYWLVQSPCLYGKVPQLCNKVFSSSYRITPSLSKITNSLYTVSLHTIYCISDRRYLHIQKAALLLSAQLGPNTSLEQSELHRSCPKRQCFQCWGLTFHSPRRGRPTVGWVDFSTVSYFFSSANCTLSHGDLKTAMCYPHIPPASAVIICCAGYNNIIHTYLFLYNIFSLRSTKNLSCLAGKKAFIHCSFYSVSRVYRNIQFKTDYTFVKLFLNAIYTVSCLVLKNQKQC